MSDKTVALVSDNPQSERNSSLMRAVGLDKLSPPQRELALSIANRYDLDLLLKHLVMIEGRAYITRDGLLHVAHRSGFLDGIETTEPYLDGEFWRASCSVYRKDMSRPFTYGGRYPAKGGNAKYAPEMAIKVAEVMALRRAFDVSAPTMEEQWIEDVPTVAVEAAPTLATRIAEKVKATTPEPVVVVEDAPRSGVTLTEFVAAMSDRKIDREFMKVLARTQYGDIGAADLTNDQREALLELAGNPPYDEPVVVEAIMADVVEPVAVKEKSGPSTACGAPSVYSDATCILNAGHPAIHRAGPSESWA